MTPPKPPGTRDWVVIVVVAAAVLLGLAILPLLGEREEEHAGKPAPDVELMVVANWDEGARVSVSALKGRPVVLDFWATHCGPCRIQTPILDRLAKKYEKDGLVILGINVDEPAGTAKAYADKYKLSYPILVDPRQTASATYGVNALPTLIVIDREGKIVATRRGLMDERSLDALIRKAM